MPIHILIVDSQLVVRRGLIMFLATDPGMIVVGESADGRQAVHMAQELKPDLILMDLLLPELSGHAVASAIRQQRPTSRMIALSSSTDYTLIAAAVLAGIDSYLHKSHPPARLLTSIRGVVAGRVMLAPALRQRILNELPPPVPPEELTRVELAVLSMLAAGRSDDDIATALHATREGVQDTVHSIQTRLAASTRLLAVLRALQLGLIEPHADA